MRRIMNWFRALFNRTMDRIEDPEMILDQARRDMQTALVNNRERAVQAIAQKNRLQGMLEEMQKKSSQLEGQASAALKQGDRTLALQLMREKINVDAAIDPLQTSLNQALEAVENIKQAIKHQEAEVRAKRGEELALKAQWKQAQIQTAISKALEGMTYDNQLEGFGAAAEKIKDKQAEAAARQEMLNSSLQMKVMGMEDKSRDLEAESEIQKLESRLGITAPGETAAIDPAIESEADRQLNELEKRIQGTQQ